ncbi:MAG: hypothetical protein HY901_09665 [Deltaproteobacteria bacterium]|nr:hypothetical protein [Deltaproteobacteria bacterium]
MAAPLHDSTSEIAAALARARAAWPRLGLDEAALTERLSALGAALAKADVEGLALALACLAGDTGAVAELERMVPPAVASALGRLGASADEIDEVGQRLRLGLFFRERADGRSKLEYYSGRGALRGWLRAVAAQEFATLKRRQRPDEQQETLADILFGSATAPDVRWARQECRAAFRTAIEEAVGALSERDRTALKMNALDGLSIDDIARVFRMHRSTAARWLVRARAEIEERVRESLLRQLGPSAGELSSIVRIAGEEVPVTFERLLGTKR